jgi:hypothetical protein
MKKKDLTWFSSKVGQPISIIGSNQTIPILTDEHAKSIYDLHVNSDIDFISLGQQVEKITLDKVISNVLKKSINETTSRSSKLYYQNEYNRANLYKKLRPAVEFKQTLLANIKDYFESIDFNLS